MPSAAPRRAATAAAPPPPPLLPLLLLQLLLLASSARGQVQPQPTYANLADGAPVVSFVAAGASSFFRFVAPLPLPRLDIVVVPLAGAPSLFVTLGKYWDPEPGNFLFSAAADFGVEIVSIPFNGSAGVTTLGDTCNPQRGYTVCWVNVNVFGTRAANFSVVLTTSAGSGALAPGVPTVGMLPAPGAADVYSLTLPQPAPPSVAFRVSSPPGGAAPLLLVSSTAQGAPRPNASDPASFCASAGAPSPRTGVASVVVLNTSACACAPQPANCTYFAAVVASAVAAAPVAYSLVAATSATAFTLLVDGVPAAGSGSAGAPAAQFLFNAVGLGGGGNASVVGRVELVASPTSGNVVLYALLGAAALAAGGGAGPGSTFASSGGPGPQTLSLSPGDARWVEACGPDPAAACPVLIGVLATTQSAAFAVVARAAAYAQLASGVPAADSAPAGGGVALFRFFVGAAAAGQPVVVSVAVTAGDAALYVGCDSSNATTRPSPAPGSFIWSATTAGDELVVVDPAADARACAPPCYYFIGVTSADPARAVGFTVLARTNSSAQAPTLLALGEVLLDAVAAHGASFFSLSWPVDALGAPAESVDVSAFSTAGSVALMARLDNASIAVAGASYAAAVAGAGEWQTLTITTTDAAWGASATCGGGGGSGGGGGDFSACAVAIVVASNTTSSASSFLISAAAGLTQLVDGVAVEASVGALPEMRYFRYSAADATPFTVSLAALSGDADLFVAAGALPNTTWSQWQSRNPAVMFVNVQWTEPWLQGSSFPVDFFVGVGGFNEAAAFSLIVSSNSYLELSPGVPLAAEARAGVLQTFLLQVPPPDASTGAAVGFSVALSPVSGDASPRIYINTVNATQSCAHCGWPTCRSTPCTPNDILNYNRRWSSEEAANPLFCEVDAMDPNFETGAVYVIAVLAAADSSFEITASFTDGVIYLVDQVATPGLVADGAYRFYVVDILNVDVTLLSILTVTAGRADLFVSVNSTNRRPTAARYDKAALAGSAAGAGGAQAVGFEWAELTECPQSSVQQTISCNAYLSVRGAAGDNSSSVFSLLADVAKPNSTAFMLEDGVPIEGVVRPADYEEFYVLLDLPQSTPFSITLTPLGVAKLVLYLTLDGSRPGPSNFLLRTQGNQGTETLSFLPDAPYYARNGTLRAVVHCPFLGWVGFQVLYSAVSSPVLIPAVPLTAALQVTWSRAWRLLVPSPSAADSVDVAYTGLSGNRATLVVGILPPGANSSWMPLPGDPATCFSAALGATGRSAAMHAPRGRSACSALCPGPAACTYVVAVSCPGIPYKEPPCTFTLVATTSARQVVALDDGQPLFGLVADAALPYRFFSIDLSPLFPLGALGNITLGATSTAGGAVQLLATNAAALPTLGGGAVWSSGGGPNSSRAVISIAPGDLAFATCRNCTVITLAVASPGARLPPGGVGFLVSASTDAGTPTRLLLGQPSQPVSVNYRGVAQYVVFLQDAGVDLLVEPTVYSGLLAYSVDPFAVPECAVGVAPARVIRCSGLWTVANAGASGPLRIAAASPCANANSSLPCDPAAAWRAGPYFISTIAFYSPTQHILTVTQPGLVVVLVDGEPQAAAASSDSPAVFSFATAAANALPASFTFDAQQARGFSFFIASCALSACSAAQLAPGPASPPGVVLLSGEVPGNGEAVVRVQPGDAAFCDSGASDSCLYVLGVFPPAGCPAATCFAAFTVAATLRGAAPQPPDPAPSSAAGGSAGAVAQLLIAGGATTAAAILLAVAVVCVRRHGCGCGKRRANGDAGLLVIAEEVSAVSVGGSGRSSPASYEQLATHRAQMREARVAQLRSSLGSTPSATPVLRGIAVAGEANDAPPLSLAGSSYSPPAPVHRDSPPPR